MIYHLTIPGRPLPKGRPRFTRTGHAYTPRTTKIYEQKIRDICTEHFDEPITCLVSMELKFYITGKRPGDLDNMIKAVGDGIQPTAIADDNQIYKITAQRIKVDKAGDQRVEIIIISD